MFHGFDTCGILFITSIKTRVHSIFCSMFLTSSAPSCDLHVLMAAVMHGCGYQLTWSVATSYDFFTFFDV